MKKLLNCMVMGLAVASLMFTSCEAAIDDNSGMLIAAAAASGASNNKDDKTEVAILTGVDFTNTSTLMLGKTAELGIKLVYSDGTTKELDEDEIEEALDDDRLEFEIRDYDDGVVAKITRGRKVLVTGGNKDDELRIRCSYTPKGSEYVNVTFRRAKKFVLDVDEDREDKLDSISLKDIQISKGGEVNLVLTANYTVSGEKQITEGVSYSVNNTDFVKVEGNKLTGVAVGDAKLTASYEGKVVTATVSCYDAEETVLHAIRIESDVKSLKFGATKAIKVFAVLKNKLSGETEEKDVTKAIDTTYVLSSNEYASVSENEITNINKSEADVDVTVTVTYTFNGESKSETITLKMEKKVVVHNVKITKPLEATKSGTNTVKLTVAAECECGETVTYQWYKDDVAISGATNSEYTAVESGSYKCVASHGGKAAETKCAVTVTTPVKHEITIVTPLDETANGTDSVVLKFEAKCSCGDTVSYQWYKDDTQISGATAKEYTAKDSGTYKCTASHGSSDISSAKCVVTITPVEHKITVTSNFNDKENSKTSVTLSVDATCTVAGIMTYQWYKDGAKVGTDKSYVADKSGSYYCEVSCGGKSGTSKVCVVTITPVITHDVSFTTNLETSASGKSVTLTVSANCSVAGDAITYCWYKDRSAIPNSNKKSITVSDKSGEYYCVATCNVDNKSVESVHCTVTIIPDVIHAVTFGEDLTSSVTADDSTTLTVSASCSVAGETITYCWYKDDTALADSDKSSITVTESGTYYCKATCSGTSINSNSCAVTINTKPSIGNAGISIDFN